MRTESVFTHFRCNQRCAYCTYRRVDDVPQQITRGAVEGRIRDALRGGAEEITLTGGEPTMRADLPDLVAFAKREGARRVVLATNATLLDRTRVAALRTAGLDGARVNLVGADARTDAITRDEGGTEAALRGLAALVEEGVGIIVQAAIVRSTLAGLPALPADLARLFGDAISALELVVPIESPDETELLAYDAVAEVTSRVAAAARRVGLAIKLAPDTAPPPCTFPELGPLAHLFSLSRGRTRRVDHHRVEACAGCAVRDRCDGFPDAYVRRFGTPRVAPVLEDRMRRRLSLIATVEQQIARELVTPNRYSSAVTGDVEEDLIRINFHCNQSCKFCFVSTHLPAASDEAVRAAIVASGRAGRRIALSGGEPTLNASVVDYVRLAKASSAFPVLMQTNAIRLASRELADALVAAGLEEAFVSLHGSTAAIGDAVTHAPGTYAKTLLGIDNLVACGVRVTLNFVICQTNVTDLVPFIELVASRWPDVTVSISFVAPSTDVVPRELELIPSYTDALPHLAEALARAEALAVKVDGFQSMCGIPLCLVPTSLDTYFALSEVPEGYDQGEFIKAEACTSCDLAGRCYGIRRGYVELHGTSELRAVRAPTATAPRS